MKKIVVGLLAVMIGGAVMAGPVVIESEPAMAAQSCVRTAILGSHKCSEENGVLKKDNSGDIDCDCDNGKGSGTKRILKFVATTLTIGVGILGVLGITIVGIQYLTAGGNEEKTRKAKRRMFEIIIGLVAYVLIYAFLNWLNPDFKAFSW